MSDLAAAVTAWEHTTRAALALGRDCDPERSDLVHDAVRVEADPELAARVLVALAVTPWGVASRVVVVTM